MRNKIVIIIGIITSFCCGQSGITYPGMQTLNTKTPEVSAFAREGNIPIDEYTGQHRVSILLYSKELYNNNFNLNLNYSPDGFMPNKQAGIVGMNWNLNYGGVITRQVKGKPDDETNLPSTSLPGDGINEHGLLVGLRLNSNNLPSNSQVYNFDSQFINDTNFGEYLLSTSVNRYEATPDIFTFNFMGISGKFIIGYDMQPKIVTNDPNSLKIDISNFYSQDQYTTSCVPLPSQIIITDNKGTKYMFGGTLNSLEYSLSYGGSLAGHPDPPRPTINSFFLRKIEYTNGSVINFNYKDGPTADNEYICQNIGGGFSNYLFSDFFVLNRYFSELRNNITATNCPGSLCASYSSTSGSYVLSNEIVKRVILDNIESENFIIKFYYNRLSYKFYTNQVIPTGFNPFNISLSKIEIKDKLLPTQNTIKIIDLNYDDLGGTYKRRFLKQVLINSIQKYSFEYYNTSNLPDPETKGIDYWGFWNGRDANQFLIPDVFNNLQTGDYQYTSNIREPEPLKYNVGLMSKIVYPTGGYSEFIYEPNTFSNKLDRTSNSQFLTTLISSSGICGGARIKLINNFDGIKNEIKEYKYLRNYNPSSLNPLSSGILMNYPRYFMSFYSDDSSIIREYKAQSISYNVESLENSPITYGEVIEIQKDINNNILGYNIRKYNDYLNTPDINENNYQFLNNTPIKNPVNLSLNYVGINFNDLSIERGKLNNEKVYDADFNIKFEKKFIYNNNISRFEMFVSNVYTSGPVSIANKLYYYPFFLTRTEEINYNTIGNINKNNIYIYNSFNSIKIETTTNSKGETLETKYYYAPDPELTNEPYKTDLIAKNMIGIPLLTQTFKNGIKLSEQKTQYSKDASTNNLLLPKYIKTKKGTDADQPNLETKITYNSYDNKGNLTQYTLESGVPVSIIWGYNQTQPIAKIENASYSQVSSYVNNLQTLSNGTNEALLLTALDALRSNLPNAMVTTYTYIPLVGVSTITDPKADRQTFTYDTFGRLQYVKDKNGNILSENQYHYRP